MADQQSTCVEKKNTTVSNAIGDVEQQQQQQQQQENGSPLKVHRRKPSSLLGKFNFWNTSFRNAEDVQHQAREDINHCADAEAKTSQSYIPRVLCECILFLKAHGLATVGIFRIPGDALRVAELREAYERDEKDVLERIDCTVHDVATLFKQSIRSLPEPVVPFHVYKRFLRVARKFEEGSTTKSRSLFPIHRRGSSSGGGSNAAGNPSTEETGLDEASAKRAKAVCEVALSLPLPQCQCLSMVLNLLYIISELSEENRMTAQALAVVFAPTLMHVPDKVPPQTVLRDMPIAIAATKILIENAAAFPLPDPILIQRRFSSSTTAATA